MTSLDRAGSKHFKGPRHKLLLMAATQHSYRLCHFENYSFASQINAAPTDINHCKAIASISTCITVVSILLQRAYSETEHQKESKFTGAPSGNCLTATQLLDGLWLNHFAYSSFISLKCAISSKNTPTRTTLSICDPAASTIALMFLQHCAVFSPMVPSIRVPFSSAGS